MASRLHVHEENKKLAKKKARMMIAPGQRIDHSFEFLVPAAISEQKLPFNLHLHAVVVFTTIAAAPITDDDDDDDDDDDNLYRHFFNDHVRAVIERDTRALLAASMTMEEIFRSSSSINQQFVLELKKKVQLELKQFGRVIVYDASVYVRPQLVDVPAAAAAGNNDVFSYVVAVAEAEAADDGAGAAGQTCKVVEEVQSSAEGGSNQEGRPSKTGQIMEWACQSLNPQILQGEEEAQSSAEDGSNQEGRPSKMGEIMESCRRACKSLKPQIHQVIYGHDTTAPEQRKKSWTNYTLKALLFACAMLFSAYMNLYSSTSITIKILFVVDIVVFFIIDGILYINLPSWGNALVCVSCLLLQVALCLLIVPFDGYYAFAILVVVFLILIIALLQPTCQHSIKKYVLPSFTTDDGDTQDIGDQENHYLNHLFDISNSITTCGGLLTVILGHYSYMVGPVTAAGFFFFSTVLLGLYLMMVIAMRAVSLPHAACLTIVLTVLFLLTIITASISFFSHSSVTM